uniref:VWFD domain-containing protein n=1 Tax=Leptobrachium leishanense TaxID=445787 RepID=A0A8C5R066_9ANUR
VPRIQTGFFLDKAECILKMSCGCVSMGRQYAINDKFWGDNECKNRCMCNPATKKVECNPHQCKSSEKCSVLNGIQNCYPLAYGICSAYGDSHYVTFDGVRYDFHGSCIYQLVGVCKKSEDLVDFQVNIQNYNKGGKMISFVTFSVMLLLFHIMLLFSWCLFQVNGILVNLPFSAESGKLSVYNNGISINLRTTFGLLVTLSWKTRITVTVPSTYVGATCGLCANFNSDTDNEFMMSNNEVASTAAQFGKSWNVEAVPECSEDAKGKCHKLDEFEKLYRSSNESCGMIIDKSGPFRQCHNIVNPEDFFKTCILDACYYNALKDIICVVITNYVAACQEARAIVFPWRASTFCSPVCGENSHYELCAPGCSPSCPMLSSPLGCNSVCSEGCVCDDGYIFSGGDCVPISQCGCKYMDKYYKLGEVFFPNLLCDQQCVCSAGGVVQCKPFTCGITKKCTVVDGIQKCQSLGSAQCSAMGDPHYFSFDGLYYDFQGNCVYTLSKMVNKNDDLIPFEIKVKNEKWGNGRVSVTKTVGLEVYGYTLILQYNMPGQILVRNSSLSQVKKLRLVNFGGTIVDIDTNFGVKVSYDLFYHVIVSVSSIYKGQVGGLCGNYNGDIKDEFQQPDQTLAPNATSFGASWKVDIKGEICDHGCGGTDNPCPMCDGRRRELFKADNYCGLLKKNRGPLSACFGIINPDNYYNSCLFDLCSSSGIVDIRCHNIQSYVAVCQAAGVTIQPWRTDFFCPLTCPANSHYKVCADVCTSSCAAITESIQCPVSCLEGCQCDENFYFDGRECVSIDKCGCFAKGTYYQLLETVKYIETLINFYFPDLCKSTKCRIKETCKVEKGKSVCVPNFTGTCYAWGDPHYQSYDDYNYDFQGTCTYVLSKYIGSDPTLVPFTIEEKNDNRGSQAVSFVRAVTIYVYGYKVSLLKGESGKISISMSGFNAVLRTNFGLQVAYEYTWHVAVTLPSSYYGATGGLCGNFNQDPKDEMITQDNKLVTSIVDWCKSWKVNDSDPLCFDVCPGICPSCDEVDKSLYESEIFCGLIKKMAQGSPFRECHPIIDPEIFFINCVYDVCIYKGAIQILCQALTAYADTCRSHGAKVYDWRTPSNCVLKCPENSYFNFCGSACPASCSQQRLPAECSMDHCVETCQCEEDFILSGDKCIPVGSCGCKYNGAYYLPNQQFWEDDYCHVLCKCESNSGFVHCVPSNCTENERCMVVHGVRGCQPISFSTCFIMKGLHYTMFDSKKFVFVGTSIYQLVGITSNDSSLIPFTVLIEYDNCGSQAITQPKVVSLLVYGMIFSLSVDFPSQILVSSRLLTYSNAVGGLCGNNNKNASDDFTMKNGTVATDEKQFGDSWKIGDINGDSPNCTRNPPQCSVTQKQKYVSDQYCGIITRSNGPFNECSSIVDPTPYLKDCVLDTCLHDGHPVSLCTAIGVYMFACQAAGVRVRDWRSDTFLATSVFLFLTAAVSTRRDISRSTMSSIQMTDAIYHAGVKTAELSCVKNLTVGTRQNAPTTIPMMVTLTFSMAHAPILFQRQQTLHTQCPNFLLW